VVWFDAAANKGHADAMEWLSIMKAEAGDTKCLVDVAAYFLSCKQSSVTIFGYEEVAAKGDASAMNSQSECYLKGLGTERNDALEFKVAG